MWWKTIHITKKEGIQLCIPQPPFEYSSYKVYLKRWTVNIFSLGMICIWHGIQRISGTFLRCTCRHQKYGRLISWCAHGERQQIVYTCILNKAIFIPEYNDVLDLHCNAIDVFLSMLHSLSSELSATMVSVNHEGNVVYEPHIVTRLKPRLRFRSNYEVELVIWSVYSPNLVEFCWQFEGTCLDRFLDNPFWDLEPQGQQSERAGSGSQYALRINVVKKN